MLCPFLTRTSVDIQVRFSTTNGPLTSINHDRLNMKFTIDAKFKANLRRSRNAKLLPVSGFACTESSVVQSPSSSPTSSTMGVPSTPELPSSPDVNNTSLYEMHQQHQQQQQQQHHYQQSAFDNSFSLQHQQQFRQNIDFDAPVKVEPVSPPMPSIKVEFPEQVQVRLI